MTVLLGRNVGWQNSSIGQIDAGPSQSGFDVKTRPSRLTTIDRPRGPSGAAARADQISPSTRTLPSRLATTPPRPWRRSALRCRFTTGCSARAQQHREHQQQQGGAGDGGACPRRGGQSEARHTRREISTATNDEGRKAARRLGRRRRRYCASATISAMPNRTSAAPA